MRKIYIIIILTFLFSDTLLSQVENFKSIHQEESDFYSQKSLNSALEFDSLQNFDLTEKLNKTKKDTLVKRVFGYFPYWAGSN